MTITDDQLAAIIAAAKAATAPPAATPPAPRIPLEDDVRRIVEQANNGAARSQQRAIGPSEMGIECDRFVAYKMLDFDPANTGRDDWLAILGTAMHAWLADAFELDNKLTGRPRWVIEKRVWLTGALGGSCDLYDADWREVSDHKLVGLTSLKKMKKNGRPAKYRVQLHLYGYGHTAAGRPVDTVNLIVYPRSDNLRGEFGGNGLHVWSEPYDPTIARAALDRVASITATAVVLDVEHHPERMSLIPAQPDDDCKYCAFFNPTATAANATGCPGPTTQPPTLPTHIPGLTAPPKSTKENHA